MTEQFFMVMGNGKPTARHDTYEQAVREAERLARLDPSQEFLVLMAVARVKRVDVVVERLSDIPF